MWQQKCSLQNGTLPMWQMLWYTILMITRLCRNFEDILILVFSMRESHGFKKNLGKQRAKENNIL